MATLAQSPGSAQPPSTSEKRPSGRQQLPLGSCNFRNLNTGSNPNTCGCRTFWLNSSAAHHAHDTPKAIGGSEQAWCFCGHHACFHDSKSTLAAVPQASQGQLARDGRSGRSIIDNNPPYTTPYFPDGTPSFLRDHLNDIDAATDVGPSAQLLDESQFVDYNHDFSDPDPPNGAVPSQSSARPQSQEQDADMVESGLGVVIEQGDRLLPTTAAARLVRRSFGGRPAQHGTMRQATAASHPSGRQSTTIQRRSNSQTFPRTTSHIAGNPASLEQAWRPVDSEQEDCAMSATEAATPSIIGTPALGQVNDAVESIKTGIDTLSQKLINNTAVYHSPENGTNNDMAFIENLLEQLGSLKALLINTPNFSTGLTSINNRIDALEYTSSNHAATEDLQEKLELFDGRLIEVEERVNELEKFHAAERPQQANKDGGICSANTSFASNAFAGASLGCGFVEVRRSEAIDRIENAESRLQTLKQLSPSESNTTWELEVIFLPFGRQLKGIWYSPNEDVPRDSMHTTQGPDEWTQEDCAVFFDQATGRAQNKADDWLSPKACAPNRIVYQRLKGRGFVQKIVIRRDDCPTVQSQIMAAFHETLHQARLAKTSSGYDHPASGLNAPLIPLRKVHKASRLRYLSPNEVNKPDLWAPQFLHSDLAMKAAANQRILFVTEPAAYLQRASVNGVGWQDLREMPRVKGDEPSPSLGSSHVGEADAAEPCWAWTARLDPPISIHSSFCSSVKADSNTSFTSHPLSPQHTDPGQDLADERPCSISDDSIRSSSSAALRAAPITPLSELRPSSQQSRHGQRDSHNLSLFRRTISLPVAVSPSTTDDYGKRQVASFEYPPPAIPNDAPRSASAEVQSVHQFAAKKKRRISRSGSPEAHATSWGFTPRRSREPLSPTARVLDLDERSATPLLQVYATPYSYCPPTGRAQHQPENAAADANMDMHGDSDGEAWQGVADDEDLRAPNNEAEAFSNDIDLDTGLSGYDSGQSLPDTDDDYMDDAEDEDYDGAAQKDDPESDMSDE